MGGTMPNLGNVFAELRRQHQVVRMAAFGSSNTQRRLMGMHWFDLAELGLKQTYGPGCVQCCNMGVGGDTSVLMLERFERDVTPFHPHFTIVTVGGNDSKPERKVDAPTFAANLKEIVRKLAALESQVLLQTYYSCDLEQLPPQHAEQMVQYMQIVRETAEECGVPLLDHFVRWERLRRSDLGLYRLLMTDRMHVNAAGNLVLGLDLLRALGIELPDAMRAEALPGYFGRKILDLLETPFCGTSSGENRK